MVANLFWFPSFMLPDTNLNKHILSKSHIEIKKKERNKRNEFLFTKTYLVLFGNSKEVNQTAHVRSLSFVFAVQALFSLEFVV